MYDEPDVVFLILTLSWISEQFNPFLTNSVDTMSAYGSFVTSSSYSNSSNLYSCGGIPSDTCVHVLALTGNGNSSTIQISLV